MILKITRPGRGFAAVLSYEFGAGKQAELLGGSMGGEKAESLAREFTGWCALNHRIGKPVFHASLSAAPDDRLTAKQWLEIARTFVQGMGYADSPWAAIRHHDRPIDHIHLVAARIDSQGRRVADFQERRRGEALCRQIERECGLQQLPSSREVGRAAPSHEDLVTFQRTGQVTVRARLQEHLDLAARGGPTMGKLIERLEAFGIEVRVRLDTSGKVSGISFAYDGLAFRGSDLGRSYSWHGLRERQGIDYDPVRDLSMLAAAAARATTQMTGARRSQRDPDAQPVLTVEHAAAAFRQAAVAESRAELQARREQLTNARRGAEAASQRLRLERALRQLPDAQILRRDLRRAAEKLGAEVVGSLSRQVARQVSLLHLGSRYLSRVAQDGPGRDDDRALGR